MTQNTEWDTTWGYDFNAYAKIFQYAKFNNIKLVGLNCNAGLTQAVGQAGLENVPQQLKAQFPEMDLSDTRHRELFDALIAPFTGTHGG
jgi:uncharacterized iron-regulated protein